MFSSILFVRLGLCGGFFKRCLNWRRRQMCCVVTNGVQSQFMLCLPERASSCYQCCISLGGARSWQFLTSQWTGNIPGCIDTSPVHLLPDFHHLLLPMPSLTHFIGQHGHFIGSRHESLTLLLAYLPPFLFPFCPAVFRLAGEVNCVCSGAPTVCRC